MKIDIHDIVANDDHVVVLMRASATRNGNSLDQNGVHVWHVNDGRATEFWDFDEDQAAGDAFYA